MKRITEDGGGADVAPAPEAPIDDSDLAERVARLEETVAEILDRLGAPDSEPGSTTESLKAQVATLQEGLRRLGQRVDKPASRGILESASYDGYAGPPKTTEEFVRRITS